MALPLPPTKKELTLPGRLADQNRRVRRREGLTLPTPRNYNFRNTASLGTTSGAGVLTLATMSNIWVKPFESVGVLVSLDAQCSAAATGFHVWGEISALGYTQLMFITETAGPVSPSWRTYGGSPHKGGAVYGGMVGTTGTEAPSGFVWTVPFWNGASESGNLTTPTAVSVVLKATRNGGAGNISFRNYRAKVMVV